MVKVRFRWLLPRGRSLVKPSAEHNGLLTKSPPKRDRPAIRLTNQGVSLDNEEGKSDRAGQSYQFGGFNDRSH